MQQQTENPPAPREVAMQFESLGGSGHGDEFGLFQCHYGADEPSLLRWAEISPHNLIQALRRRFAGVGEAENTDILLSDRDGKNEWWSRDRRFWMEMRALATADEVAPETVRDRTQAQLCLLRDKLLSDLAAPGKIFVYKNASRNLTYDELALVYCAVRAYGNGTLLYLRYADDEHPHATVARLAPGLLAGAVEHFSYSPSNEKLEPPYEAFLAICREAVRLWRDPTLGARDPEASLFQATLIRHSLIGHVDALTPAFIAGWAADITRPDDPVDVSVFVDGRLLAQVTCDGLRRDMAGMLGLGNGRHAFHFAPDPPITGSAPVHVSVRFTGTEKTVEGGDTTLQVEPAAAPPAPAAEPLPDYAADPHPAYNSEPQQDDEPEAHPGYNPEAQSSYEPGSQRVYGPLTHPAYAPESQADDESGPHPDYATTPHDPPAEPRQRRWLSAAPEPPQRPSALQPLYDLWQSVYNMLRPKSQGPDEH